MWDGLPEICIVKPVFKERAEVQVVKSEKNAVFWAEKDRLWTEKQLMKFSSFKKNR